MVSDLWGNTVTENQRRARSEDIVSDAQQLTRLYGRALFNSAALQPVRKQLFSRERPDQEGL
jgi:hypothetical protein